MKVRAKNAGLNRITPGKEYVVDNTNLSGEELQYSITTDKGYNCWFHHSHFIVIEEQKPEITVGGEWVSKKGGVNKVKYVGDVVVLENSQGKEFSVKSEYFHKSYKPKPKTVTKYIVHRKDGKCNVNDRMFGQESAAHFFVGVNELHNEHKISKVEIEL